jgi:HEAT repeat protein
MAFFCPVCFGLSESGGGQCLLCGTDLQLWSQTHSYAERLMQAILHPVAEVRMAAIIALGLRGETQAACALADCAMAHSVDVPEGLEIVNALTRLAAGREGLAGLQRLATQHPASAVRVAANKALTKLRM